MSSSATGIPLYVAQINPNGFLNEEVIYDLLVKFYGIHNPTKPMEEIVKVSKWACKVGIRVLNDELDKKYHDRINNYDDEVNKLLRDRNKANSDNSSHSSSSDSTKENQNPSTTTTTTTTTTAAAAAATTIKVLPTIRAAKIEQEETTTNTNATTTAVADNDNTTASSSQLPTKVTNNRKLVEEKTKKMTKKKIVQEKEVSIKSNKRPFDYKSDDDYISVAPMDEDNERLFFDEHMMQEDSDDYDEKVTFNQAKKRFKLSANDLQEIEPVYVDRGENTSYYSSKAIDKYKRDQEIARRNNLLERCRDRCEKLRRKKITKSFVPMSLKHRVFGDYLDASIAKPKQNLTRILSSYAAVLKMKYALPFPFSEKTSLVSAFEYLPSHLSHHSFSTESGGRSERIAAREVVLFALSNGRLISKVFFLMAERIAEFVGDTRNWVAAYPNEDYAKQLSNLQSPDKIAVHVLENLKKNGVVPPQEYRAQHTMDSLAQEKGLSHLVTAWLDLAKGFHDQHPEYGYLGIAKSISYILTSTRESRMEDIKKVVPTFMEDFESGMLKNIESFLDCSSCVSLNQILALTKMMRHLIESHGRTTANSNIKRFEKDMIAIVTKKPVSFAAAGEKVQSHRPRTNNRSYHHRSFSSYIYHHMLARAHEAFWMEGVFGGYRSDDDDEEEEEEDDDDDENDDGNQFATFAHISSFRPHFDHDEDDDEEDEY